MNKIYWIWKISYKKTRLCVTTSDYEWLTTSESESGYKLLRVITNGYEWLWVKSETLMDLKWLVTIAGKKVVQIINYLITFFKFIINISSTIFVLRVNTARPSCLHLIKHKWLMLKLRLNYRDTFSMTDVMFLFELLSAEMKQNFRKGLLVKGSTKKDSYILGATEILP